MKVSRRNFLRLSGAALATGALGVGGYHLSGYQNTTEKLDVRSDRITLKRLPDGLQNFKIAFLSDIHLGPYLTESFLLAALSAISAAKPDILILGGDHLHVPSSLLSKIFGFPRNPQFAEGRAVSLAKRIIDRLAELLQTVNSKHGILAIPGNHDNSNAYRFIKERFGRRNIRYLINETHTIESDGAFIDFVAVDDYWTGVPRLPRPNVSSQRLRILCAHNPDFASLCFAQPGHGFDLALTGHTHAGQICTSSNRPLICNVYNRRFVHGIVPEMGTPILVSAGLGTVEIPYRVNCPAEVHLITLTT